MPIGVLSGVGHTVPLLHDDLQITDAPELTLAQAHLGRQDLVRPVLLQPTSQVGSLVAAQFERVVAAPLRLQAVQTALTITLTPVANSALGAANQALNLGGGDTAAIQPHRLQAFQCIAIAGTPFGFPKRLLFLLVELKLSFCHRPILHQV